jgi:2-dehydro-3-deoxyphosphogluconate aldolase/(4S)-4-hydroxy-2-oxoglutarate aldolase
MKFLEALRATKIVGIVRAIEHDELATLADACKSAGLSFIEITMNTPDAAHKIAALNRMAERAFRVGAGTVLAVTEYRQAIDAGAEFIVSPVLVPEVAAVAVSENIPFLPGALSPQEVYDAHAAGAALVKVFPMQFFGPAYIRELRGPFGEIPLLACGGIRPTNVREYLQSGADAVAIGGGTLKREWLAGNNVAALSAALRELIAATRA